jgi:hypothetical protein
MVSRIRNFLLNTVDAVSLNLRELLQLEALQTDLRDRFHDMATEWDVRRTDPEAELAFLEVNNYIGIATRAVKKALQNSDAFLEVQYLTELELHRFDETKSDEAGVNCCVNEGTEDVRTTPHGVRKLHLNQVNGSWFKIQKLSGGTKQL